VALASPDPASNTLMQSRLQAWATDAIAQQKLPCVEILVWHKGKVICEHHDRGIATIRSDAGELIYRLYSMTKPIVTCAAMSLYEEAKFQLDTPVWRILGDKWKKDNMKVVDLAESVKTKSLVTVPCRSDITLGQLLTHTSGLSHGLTDPRQGNIVDGIYAAAGISGAECILLSPKETGLPSLQVFCDKLVECPLLFQPGTAWQYSYGLEVMGHAIELLTKKTLEEFVQERICGPLQMKDTTFFLSKDQELRLCPFYFAKDGMLLPEQTHFPSYCSGSAGLFSTLRDYSVFCRAMLRGGLGDNGQRILSPKTVEWMMQNHLHKNGEESTIRELSILDQTLPFGFGFGFGAAVAVNTSFDRLIVSKGEWSWAGAASTNFWVDPEEDIVVVFMTSVLESDREGFPLTSNLHSLVYGALDETKAHPKPT